MNQAMYPQYEARSTQIAIDPWMVLAALYPVTQLVTFDLVGQLYLTDLAGIVLFIVMLQRGDALQRLGQIKWLFFLLALWFLGQIITDLVRLTPTRDLMRGWAKIAMFAIQLGALWLFLPQRRAYFLAFALGMAVAAFFGVPEEFSKYPWKFGYARGLGLVALAGLCLLWWRGGTLKLAVPFVLAAVSLVALSQNARSEFAIALMAAGMCVAILAIEAWPRLQERIGPTSFALLLLAGVALSGGISSAYGSLAESGALGSQAKWKYMDQTEGDIPLILGGRSESVVSLRAIADSPLLGHGSWAKDIRYALMYRALTIQMGIKTLSRFDSSTGLIPAHSYFFGAWVEAGILGAVFWLAVFLAAIASSYYLFRYREPLAPLIAWLAVGLVWSIPFSPFGATERFFAAYQITMLLWFIVACRDAASRRALRHRAEPA